MSTNSKPSIVWHFFEKYKEHGRKKSKCRLCNHTANYHKNTTYLKDHLKRRHPLQLTLTENEVKPRENYEPPRVVPSSSNDEVPVPPPLVPLAKKQKQVQYNVASQTEVDCHSLDRALLRMIVVDYQPLTIVENIGFIEFVKRLQPNYDLSSKKKLSQKILAAEYQTVFRKVSDRLCTVSDLSITTDLWTASSNKCYLTITGHFIYEFKLNSYVLGTEETGDNHTASNISEAINNIMAKYPGSLNKISTVITNNRSYIEEAVTDYLKKSHDPCIAIILNSFVQESITNCDGLNAVLTKCRALHNLLKYSNVASYKVRETQKQMEYPMLKFKKDISNTWNSILFMLQRISEVKIPLCTELSSLSSHENLEPADWEIIDDIIQLLKPVHKTTEELSREDYPALSRTIPLIGGLQYVLVNKFPTTEVGLCLKSCLIEAISRILCGLEESKSAALRTLLDPRFKKSGFGVAENAETAQTWLIEMLANEIGTESGHTKEVHIQQSEVIIQSKNDENDLWHLFDQKVLSKMSATTPNSLASLQVKQYLELPLINRKEDPLNFWRNYDHTFNSLSRLALKYLSIPATSVPAERIFSKEGLLATRRRNRLSPKKLNEIIFLNKNIDD